MLFIGTLEPAGELNEFTSVQTSLCPPVFSGLGGYYLFSDFLNKIRVP